MKIHNNGVKVFYFEFLVSFIIKKRTERISSFSPLMFIWCLLNVENF